MKDKYLSADEQNPYSASDRISETPEVELSVGSRLLHACRGGGRVFIVGVAAILILDQPLWWVARQIYHPSMLYVMNPLTFWTFLAVLVVSIVVAVYCFIRGPKP